MRRDGEVGREGKESRDYDGDLKEGPIEGAVE